MEDLATLGIAVDASQVDAAAKKLDGLTGSGGAAETAIDKLVKKSAEMGGAAKAMGVSLDEVDRRVESLKSSIDPLYAAQSKLNKEMAEAKTLFKAGALAAGDYDKIVSTLDGKLNRVAQLQNKAAGGAKLHAHELLNLSRQSADVGVSLAMGMNPLMVLIQQGPQISETFGMAAARGMGFKAVMADVGKVVWAAVAPFAPLIAGVAAAAAVIGGGFLMATHEANKANGDLAEKLHLTKKELQKLDDAGVSTQITFGDTFTATFKVAGERLATAFAGPIKAVKGFFASLYEDAVNGADWMVGGIVGSFYVFANVAKGVFSAMGMALKGDFAGAKDALSTAFSDGVTQGMAKGRKAWKSFASDVSKEAGKIRTGAIEKAIDRPDAKDKKTAAEKEYERKVKASQDYIKQLEKEAATVGLDTVEKKKWEIEEAASIAPTKALAAAIREKGAALIEATKAAALANMTKAADEQASKTALLASMINATNKERAVAVALQTAELAMTAQHIDLQSKGAVDILAKVKANAEASYELDNGLGSTLDKLNQIAELSADVASRISSAAGGLGEAFGSVGTAIGGLVSTYADLIAKQDAYAAKMEDLRKNGKTDTAEFKNLSEAKATAERRATGDMIKSAKGFFKEKSAGYKMLDAAEKAWRLFEFAMEAKSVVVKMATTAAKLPAYAAEATAAAAAGAANMFAVLGPFGFAAVAAMGVVLAAWGMKGGKGGGGASVAPASAETQQASQGAGAVFGDPTAKSASLANSLTLAEKYQNKDLEFSNSMVNYLKAIDGKMGVMASAVAKQIGLSGGMFDTSGLNLGTNGKKGFLGIGSKTTTNSLYDLGLKFGSQNVADIMNNGINGSTYQTVKSETTKSGFFGLGGGTKTTYATTAGEIDAEIKNSIADVIKSLRSGVIEAAGQLGIDGAAATIDAMTLAIGNLSFEGMTGSEIQETLNAVFGKLGDQMASAVGGGLVEKFKQIGEGAFETLVRIATGVKAFDQQFETLGKTFSLTGSAAVEAKQGLIDLMGGLDPFIELTNTYAEKFLTEAERLAPVQKAVAEEMARLGFASVISKDQFKALVNGIDANTEAGRTLFASLMQVAPAFAKVADAADAAAKSAEASAKAQIDALQKIEDEKRGIMEKARTDLIASYTDEANALKTTVGKLRDLSRTLRDFGKSLFSGPMAYLSPEDNYKSSKSLFDKTLAGAKSGDQTAAAALPQIAEAFLNASREYFASSSGYYTDRDYVAKAVEQIASITEGQADAAQQQLDALNEMVDGIDGVIDGVVKLGDVTLKMKDGIYVVDSSVKSVASAIGAFALAMGEYTTAVNNRAAAAEAIANAALAAANAAAVAATTAATQISSTATATTTNTVPTVANDNGAANWNSYLTSNPDVAAEAARLLATADKNSPWFAAHGLDGGAAGFAEWHYNNAGKSEGRKPYAAGGIIHRPMTIGEAGITGEAGPESILPLTRVGGKLGVSASSDDEAKALLREIRDHLKGANMQRRDAALETLARLDSLIDANEQFGREVARK